MQITLERRYFATNDAGSNEFDWFLSELGVSESEQSDIDTVELEMSAAEVTLDGDTVTVKS